MGNSLLLCRLHTLDFDGVKTLRQFLIHMSSRREVTSVLYKYLTSKYKPNEPIFLNDVALPGVADSELRQMFKNLCVEGKIKCFENDIFYLPAKQRIKGGSALSVDTVMRYKYISRNGNVYGYYSGFTFANAVGLTLQVPFVTEITSNEASANTMEISLKGRRFILRKPRARITEENFKVLQLLDLMMNLDIYVDEGEVDEEEIMKNYVNCVGITKAQVDKYIQLYPDSTYKAFNKIGLIPVLM